MGEALRDILPEVHDGPCPTVLLRHELPDGSWHVDWLIARAAEAGSRLVSFRLPQSLTDCSTGDAIAAEHIGDHRPAYLTYEGPISGNRGHVRRLRSGHVTHVEPNFGDRSCRFNVSWDANVGCDAKTWHVQLIWEENSRWNVKILETKTKCDTITE